MMASDIHHRTEDFRTVYKAVLADLKEVMGTSHDVLLLPPQEPAPWKRRYRTCSRAAIKSSCARRGNFGERWAEITKRSDWRSTSSSPNMATQ